MTRIVVEILNGDGRIVAQSAVGDEVVTWGVQTSTLVKAGHRLRARVLGDDEHPMEVERT